MPGLFGFFLNRLDELLHVSRFCQIVVNLVSYGFQCCCEIGIPGENQCDRARLNAAHGTDQGESVSLLAYV